MANTNSSENRQELIAGYVLGDLSPEEAETLNQLLATQPELEQDIQQLQAVLAVMPYALPEVAPPPQVRSRLLSAVETTPAATQAGRRQHRWRRWGAWAGAGLAAAIAVAIGIDNYQLRQQLASSQQQIATQRDLIAMLQTPQTQLVRMEGMDLGASAAGNVVVTPTEDEAILVLHQLPRLPQGQFYYLWEVVNGKKVACGKFVVNERGNVFIKVPLSRPNQVTELVVTLENSPSMENPQGPMVMTSRL